MFVTAERQTLR